MKKVLILGRETTLIKKLAEQEGLIEVEQDPDVIITYGGDGLLLSAEQKYPGIPKLPLRHNSICKTCVDHDMTHAIKALARQSISSSIIKKLEATVNGQHYVALNEFSLHHVQPNQAIRFSVQVNDEEYINRAIGDGVIVATPFGSHAYYRSITNGTFRLGIGIAYNNTTEPIDHAVIQEDDTVHITVDRGPAYFLADNQSDLPILQDSARIAIRQSKETATLLGLTHFRCPDCGLPQAEELK